MAIGDAKYKDQTSGEIGDILVLESSLKMGGTLKS